MKLIVGVADMKVSRQTGDLLVTHALGSCLGIAAYDPLGNVGGLLHVMMPASSLNPGKAAGNPCMFVDTGLVALLRCMRREGAMRTGIVVKVAGGANVQGSERDRFAIGKRNYLALRKALWLAGLSIRTEDVGGRWARTMFLEVGSGRVWVTTVGGGMEL